MQGEPCDLGIFHSIFCLVATVEWNLMTYLIYVFLFYHYFFGQFDLNDLVSLF